MARAHMVSPSTVILALADRSGAEGLVGRTRIQKMIYFLRERLPIAATYTAYYYGPYSEEVTASLDSLVAHGLLEEEVEPITTEGPFEGRLYRYKLTDDGRAVIDSLREQAQSDIDDVERAAHGILDARPRTATLAVASKLHYLVSKSSKPVGVKDMPRRAKRFGWQIGTEHISGGVQFLKDHGFVSTS